MGEDRFDHYSKTVYCACVRYVTFSALRAVAEAIRTPILKESSTLVISVMRVPV